MVGKSVLVDTNVIIYLIGGHRITADLLLNSHLHFLFISEIELLNFKKLLGKEEQIIKSLLSESIVLQSDSQITTYARIRRGHGLEVPDAIIAATAIRYNLPLLTVDRDMSKVKRASSDTIFALMYNFRKFTQD